MIRPYPDHGCSFTLPLFCGFCSLVPLLFLGSVPAYAEWVAFEKSYLLPGLQRVYFEPDTIHREGDLVTIWQLIDFKWMQGNPRGPARFLSTKTLKQFDCAGTRVRMLAFTEFSRPMGTGIADDGYIEKTNWVPVESDSINQALWEVACSKE